MVGLRFWATPGTPNAKCSSRAASRCTISPASILPRSSIAWKHSATFSWRPASSTLSAILLCSSLPAITSWPLDRFTALLIISLFLKSLFLHSLDLQHTDRLLCSTRSAMPPTPRPGQQSIGRQASPFCTTYNSRQCRICPKCKQWCDLLVICVPATLKFA
jgi:hypothetical protein